MINPFKSQITDNSQNLFYSNIDAIYLFAFLPVALLLVALMFWLGRFFVEKHREQKLQAQKLSFVYAALAGMENCAPNKKLSRIYEAILFQFGDKTMFYQPTKPVNV